MADTIERVSFDLPADIIFDVLSRLPVKTLVWFKSVSKTWYDLIENPNFVETHKKMQPSVELELIYNNMIVTTNGPENTKKCSLLHFSEASHKLIDTELSYLSCMEDCVLVGVCNGLVCLGLSSKSTELIVCNPTTRQFRQTPTFILPKIVDDLIFLGFCSHVYGYEIIRIIFTPRNDRIIFTPRNGMPDNYVIRAELYTMCTGTWREIEVKLGESDWFWDLSQRGEWDYLEAVVICGIFFWKAHSAYGDPYVVSFDKCKGLFDVIEAPWVAYDAMGWQLHEIQGKLGLVLYEDHNIFELHVMNEGMDWSMIQEIDISDIPSYPADRGGFIKVLGNGELVLCRVDNSKLLMYDLKGREVKCLRNVDFEGVISDAYLYTLSLAPVNLGRIYLKKEK